VGHFPVGPQAKFCLFSETPEIRVLRPSPPASASLRGAQRNFPKLRSAADWGALWLILCVWRTAHHRKTCARS
jgi:hypothetical protein